MKQGKELAVIARKIIDSIVYMVLGTADETGRPWVSPVYFACENYREFYWMSSPDATHSRTLFLRPQISIVIFDSRVPVGTGQAVYLSAAAEMLNGIDLAHGIHIYNGRFQNPAEHGVRTIKAEDVWAPAERALAGAGIKNLKHLTKFSEAEIKQLHGIGPNALGKLREALHAKGISFADKKR